ncbi:hypothetical protein DMNBHIDG_01814 [Candidatus Methanoperedenaceae archaeon GB37]|nr:hypothetical protein DMNBHIDG_01814 [Candidatus Methanoperedenaceae archaeon GB37]
MMAIGEIIAIGDELLVGEVMDTNSFELAGELYKAGFVVNRITVVGDEHQSIQDGPSF